MADSTMIVTGATGFLGRHLIEAFHREYDIWAISRAAPSLRGVSFPADVRWLPIDVASPPDVRAAVEAIRHGGGADVLVHLAGHYDFTGERDPEYERTNVEGTRLVLEAAAALGVRDVIFASSVAACAFPQSGALLTEASPPDGDTPYAESKRTGESMMAAHRGDFRRWIVRLGAVFSDWCEYEPLFRFLESWLANRPTRRILAGSGRSAIPYLHVRDVVTFFRTLLKRREELGDGAVLLASPDGATSHRELFEAATGAQHGQRERPILVPGSLCRAGLRARDLLGLVIGLHAFERPWMGRMIDLRLGVDSSRTRTALGWEPRARFGILRRMPFLVQNRKSFGAEWLRRNHGALKGTRRQENREIVAVLEQRRDEIAESLARYVTGAERARRFPHLQAVGAERQRADGAVLLGALVQAVRTGEKALFRDTCQQLARQRLEEGLPAEELTGALDTLGDQCVLSLADHDPSRLWSLGLQDHVTMTVQFGIDGVLDVFETEPGERRSPAVRA